MHTGHHDTDGNDLCEGDILEHLGDPQMRGIVVSSDGDFYIDCADCPGVDNYHISDAHNWCVIGNLRESPDLVK